MVAQKKRMNSPGDLKFEKQVLPRLVAAYENRLLVPFLGAGMSVDVCTDWPDFIYRLEDRVENLNSNSGHRTRPRAQNSKSRKKPTSDELIRRGNEAVRSLKLVSADVFTKAVADALMRPPRPKRKHRLPKQTLALAKIFWPLVLTTNYDDLFIKAWNQIHHFASMDVVGRKPDDCHTVLSSLNNSSTPLLWALQGFLPGASEKCKKVNRLRSFFYRAIGDPRERQQRRRDRTFAHEDVQSYFSKFDHTEGESFSQHRLENHLQLLRDELIVGHEEYRRVAFAQPLFRRAFAEVFRSRSLLFLGSNLSEQYFLNLFGEVLEIFGSNPNPHYALAHKENKLDVDFLRSRLNIFVHVYNDHDELPKLLQLLHKNITAHHNARSTMSFAVPTSNARTPKFKADQIKVIAGPATLIEGEPVVVFGRRDKRDGWLFSTRSHGVLARLGLDPDQKDFDAQAEMYLLILDIKDPLGQVGHQFELWFDQAVARGCNRIHVPWANEGSTMQRFLAISIISAFGRWIRSSKATELPELLLHITDPSVLFDFRTRQIDPVELMRCDDVRFRVGIHPLGSSPIIEFYQTEIDAKIVDIAKAMSIPLTEEWFVEAIPAPTGRHAVPFNMQSIREASPDHPQTIAEIGVLPNSMLSFIQVPPTPEGAAEEIKNESGSKKTHGLWRITTSRSRSSPRLSTPVKRKSKPKTKTKAKYKPKAKPKAKRKPRPKRKASTSC